MVTGKYQSDLHKLKSTVLQVGTKNVHAIVINMWHIGTDGPYSQFGTGTLNWTHATGLDGTMRHRERLPAVAASSCVQTGYFK